VLPSGERALRKSVIHATISAVEYVGTKSAGARYARLQLLRASPAMYGRRSGVKVVLQQLLQGLRIAMHVLQNLPTENIGEAALQVCY
jgi:hypothetical protein